MIPRRRRRFVRPCKTPRGAPNEPEPAEPRDLYGDPLPPGALARLGTVRLRPGGGAVDSIVFTPDGKQMVVNVRWGAVSVWDVASGKEVCRYTPERPTRIDAAQLTSDGQSVVTVEGMPMKSSIRIRNRADLKVIRTIPVAYSLYSPRLMPDGKHLIAVGRGRDTQDVEVWDLESGKRVRRWTNPARDAFLRLSRDGKTVVTIGGNNNSIRVWNVETGRLIRDLGAFGTFSNRVAVSPDGKLVATLTMDTAKVGAGGIIRYDNRVRIWDVVSGKEVRQLLAVGKGLNHGYPPGFWNVAFSPDGKHVVTAGQDGLLRVWETASGKELRQWPIGRANVSSLAFTPDGKTLAVGGHAIRLLDWKTGKNRLPQFGHVFLICSVAVAPDGRTIATGAEGPIQLWDAATGEPKGRLDGHGSSVHRLHWCADGRTLLSAGGDRTVRLWDVATSEERKRFVIPDDVPRSGWFGPRAVTHDGAVAAMLQSDRGATLDRSRHRQGAWASRRG